MTDGTASSVPAMGLFARIAGVITSPRATFERIVAVPQPFGVLFVCALLIGIGGVAPQFTEAGRQATVDMQVRSMEQFGATVSDEMYEALEARSRSVAMRLVSIAGPFVSLPIFALVFTALCWAFFNAILGGTAAFKQVLAIVTHSYVISALGLLAGLPLQILQGRITMGGPFNLGALAPMLDDTSTVARFLSGISVFSLWGLVVTAIGLGVLYRRSSRNIAIGLIVVFLAFMYAVTAAFGSLLGSR